MASEIRVDKINSLSGVGTVTLSPTGVDIAGITTAATLRATTGIVTSLTAGSLTSLGAVSGTTGTFSAAVSGTTGTFSAAVSGTTGTFSGAVSGTTGTFTGDLTIPDKIVHTGDTDTAIRLGVDTVTVETAGSERIRIDSSGNFLVGATSGSGKFHVQQSAVTSAPSRSSALYLENNANCEIQFVGNSSNDCQLRFGTSSNSFKGAIEYQLDNNNLIHYTNGTEKARIDSDGDFGLGTTSPAVSNSLFGGSQRTLHVSGTAAPMVRIQSSTSGQADLLLQAGNSGSDAYIANAASNGDIVFSTNNGGTQGTKLRIRHDGGINFNSDDSTATALDDYEEGTWTPRLGGTNNHSTYYVTGNGWYRKIGSMVYTCVRFNSVDLDNNASGEVKIHNLPFTVNSPASSTDSMTSDFSTFNVVFNTSYQYAWYASNGGTSWVGLVSRNNTSWASWAVSDFHAGNLYINFSGWYQTDS
jgi:hypothetical protein